MFETIWNDIKSKNDEILQSITKYKSKINEGSYLEFECTLDVVNYYNFLTAHIFNLLLDDKMLFVSKSVISMLSLDQSDVFALLSLNDVDGRLYIDTTNDKEKLIKESTHICFSDKGKNFIQELCAQDIVSSQKTAKEISSILGLITTAITFDSKGEEEIFRQLSQIRSGGEKTTSCIEKRYNKEYSGRGALIYNRLFKHTPTKNVISNKVIFSNNEDGLLDYKTDDMFCQAAILHIGVAETGSSGTGFRITEDGYALTCAHVVEGANEVSANVIVGDGYPLDGFEDFGIYDVGFGEVVYLNKELDIALLKTEYCGSKYLSVEQGILLPEIGEEVVVFGYPLGYEMPQTNKFGPNISFYKGYVSSNQVKDGNSVTFLDIDVKSGNSGSPVISAKTGKVIGIISGIKVGGRAALNEKMPYMIPIQHFLELNKKQ